MKKRILALILCLTLALGCTVPAFAQSEVCTCGDAPLIYVGPLGNNDIVRDAGTEDETILFRIPTKTILNLVAKVLPALAVFGITHNYDNLGDKLIPALNDAFGDMALDGDGNSKPNVTSTWDWPTDKTHGQGRDYYFHYDWRLDPMEVADQLHDFVEYVEELTGHDTVKFRASSMGGVVTMAYFAKYGYSDVEACVFQCCPLQGTNVAGELLSGQIALNGKALLTYGSQAFPPADAEGILPHFLFNILYYSGTVDAVMNFGGKLLDNLADRIFEEMLIPSFGTLLGLWSFVPDAYYDRAKANSLNPATQAGLIAKADDYHYNVQCKAEQILTGAVDAGVRVMIVAGCGMQRTPLVPDTMHWDSDCTVDTCYASAGATVAHLGSTLPAGYTQAVDDGHNHISPENTIDASTCILPERTWFIKGMLHANCHDGISALYAKVLYSEEDFTVWSDPNYPQFLQNDKPNLRVIPMGNFAPGASAPTVEPGSSFYDFYTKFVSPVEDTFLGLLDWVRMD